MRDRAFLLFIAPSAGIMLAFMTLPLLALVGLSTFNLSLGSSVHFVGFGNYAATLGSARFWAAVAWTLTYCAIAIPLELVIGLAIALALDEVKRFRGLWLSAILIPFIVTPVVGTMIFGWLFKDYWGFYAQLLDRAGIYVPWFSSEWGARWLLILFRVWNTTPFVILVLFAGLQAMPREPIEAAIVDGASAWQRLLHVVLPQLQPLILFVAAITLMDHYREFDSVMVMTTGGPGTATETVMYLNYVVSFSEQALGRGAAISVLTVAGVLVLLAPLVVLMYREQRER
ncbi:MAG: sugar ABC transporter permease [Vicinamibacterales bacterium]